MKTLKTLFAITLLIFSTAAFSQHHKVDVEKSTLKWTGKKVTGEHYGHIKLKEGHFVVKDNKIASGEFVIDMNTINCKDLTDAGYNAKLVGHLKSDDFFGVEKNPTAVLKITKSGLIKDGKVSVTGDLTIKGQTHPVSFDILQKEGSHHATIIVDRSKYNIKYGSGKFFEDLGDKMIYDEFTLDVNIAANAVIATK